MGESRELTWKLRASDNGASSEISKIDKQIDKLKAKMQGADSALGKFGAGMGLAGANMQKMGGKIMGASKGLKDFGSKATKFMLPVTLAIGKGVKDFLKLDTAIRQVTTLTDENVLPVGQIKKDIREISDATGVAQEEIANSMYDALSSGVDQRNVKEFVKSGIDLKRAGFTDMPTVIDATTTALNAYGAAAPKVSKIHDIFVKTQDLGKITVDELGKSMNEMKNTMMDVGGMLSPYILDLANGISKVVKKFSELDSSTQSTIIQWVGLAIAIGPVAHILGIVGQGISLVVSGGGMILGFLGNAIGLFGSITGVLGSVAGGFFSLMTAIGPVGWAIMAVVGIGIYLIANFKKIKAEAQNLGGGIKGYLLATLKVTGQNFTSLKNKAVGALNAIKSAWNSVKNFLKNPIKGIISIAQKGMATLSGGGSAKGKGGEGATKRVPHASGLEKVPFDNYPADLHKDEMVLTANAAKAFRELGGTKNSIPTNNTQNNNYRRESINSSPTINVNIYGERKVDEAKNIGLEVRKELDAFFREIQLQEV